MEIAAIVTDPRRARLMLKAPSTRPPPSDFATSAPSLLKWAAAQEVRLDQQTAAAAQRPPTAPTTPEGPKRVQSPMLLGELTTRDLDEKEDADAPKRPAGLSRGAKLVFSLFSASVLGAVVGGSVARMTLPPPSPVVCEPALVAPTAPPSPVVCKPAPVAPTAPRSPVVRPAPVAPTAPRSPVVRPAPVASASAGQGSF
ncbi:MAG TPA: hypothetical protein VIG99_20375 [Myxococcaceae bacterium]